MVEGLEQLVPQGFCWWCQHTQFELEGSLATYQVGVTKTIRCPFKIKP